MTTIQWTTAALGAILGLWLALDGLRALVKGDYVTPSSGPHAGQLGPWSQVVRASGLEPRSALVKCLHVVLGLGWIGAAVWYLAGEETACWALLACVVASLWYLPFGTIIGVLEIAALSYLAWR